MGTQLQSRGNLYKVESFSLHDTGKTDRATGLSIYSERDDAYCDLRSARCANPETLCIRCPVYRSRGSPRPR